jgi:hypothetical protein
VVRHSGAQIPPRQMSGFEQSELNEQGRPETTALASGCVLGSVPSEVSSLGSAHVAETQTCPFTQSSEVAQPSRHWSSTPQTWPCPQSVFTLQMLSMSSWQTWKGRSLDTQR